MKIIDITRDFFESPLYPGTQKPQMEKILDMKNGDSYNLSVINTEVHVSTHADAFCHFIYGGTDIANMPLEHYIGQCCVVECDSDEIDEGFLLKSVPKDCKILLVKGGTNRYFTSQSGYVLKSKGVITVGTEAWSVGPLDNEKAVHESILNEEIAIIENLDMSEVKPGKYFLSAAPIKLSGSDGAPVRAVLIEY